MGRYILSISVKLDNGSLCLFGLVFKIPTVKLGPITGFKIDIFIRVTNRFGVKVEEAIRMVKKVSAGNKKKGKKKKDFKVI